MDTSYFPGTPTFPSDSSFNCPIASPLPHAQVLTSSVDHSSNTLISDLHISSHLHRTSNQDLLRTFEFFNSRYLSLSGYSDESDDPRFYMSREMELDDEVYSLYGELCILLWENIKDIFPYLTQPRGIPSRIMRKFLMSDEKAKFQLISRLPSLSDIFDSMSKEDDWSSFLSKVLLDMYNSYLLEYDGPIYSIYLTNFLPVVIYFYSQLDSVICINFRSRVLKRTVDDKEIIVIQRDTQEYLQYFNQIGRTVERLTEGLNQDSFFV